MTDHPKDLPPDQRQIFHARLEFIKKFAEADLANLPPNRDKMTESTYKSYEKLLQCVIDNPGTYLGFTDRILRTGVLLAQPLYAPDKPEPGESTH